MAESSKGYGETIIQSVKKQDGITVVTVVGDIDLMHSLRFQSELSDIVHSTEQKIVMILSAVPYMDSSGIASLVKLLSECREKKVELALVGMTERVRGMFEIMRLDSMFKMFESIDEAMV
ncbi:MAG TPA: anti-sigma factor antagonist [Phycisphaerae bacterium]|nr:anti-sigma factor antagonist [Phycisphaerae bacterium]